MLLQAENSARFVQRGAAPAHLPMALASTLPPLRDPLFAVVACENDVLSGV